MVEDVTSDFRFSALILANQIRYPAVTTTQQQQNQNTYANVVQNTNTTNAKSKNNPTEPHGTYKG